MAGGQHSGLPAADRDKREESLFRALGSSTTALRLAKAYIRCKNEELQALGSKFDVDDYLQLYNRELSLFWRSPSEYSIITTVTRITIGAELCKDEEFGSELGTFVLVLAHFASGDIPLGMVSSLASDRQKLERIVQTLDRYSILRWNKDTGMLTMDDLIRQSHVRELNDEDCIMLQALNAVLDTDSTTIRHALEWWNRAARSERWSKELYKLSSHIVLRYLDVGNYDAALSFGRKALEIVKKALVPDHPGLLKLEDIVKTIPAIKKSVAEKLRLIEASKLSARQQPERLNEFLAQQYRLAFDMGYNAKESLRIMREVHEKRLVSLGPEHRDTLLTRGHIARLEYQLDNSKCNQSYEVLADVVEVLGDGTEADHDEVADIRNCLVLLLINKGELDEALKRQRRFYGECKSILGPKHYVTMKFLEDMGGILLRRSEHREALEVFTEVHKLLGETIGHNHFKARRTMSLIGDIKAAQDRLNGCQFMRELFLLDTFYEATKLFRRGSFNETADLLYVIEHSELPASSSMHLIVITLRAKLQARTDAIGGLIFFGTNMNESTQYVHHLSSLMENFDRNQVDEFRLRYASALDLFVDNEYEASYRAFVSSLVEEWRRSTFEEVRKLKAQFNRAKTLHNLERFEESLCIFKQVFEKQRELLGPDDVVTLNTEHEMADVLDKLDRHNDAVGHFRHVYEKRKQLFGPGNLNTASVQLNLGRSLVMQEKCQEALDIFRSAFDETVAKLGLNHLHILRAQYYIAYCLCRQGNYFDSFLLFKKVYLALRKKLGDSHEDTLEAKKGLEASEMWLKQDPKCREGIDRALDDYVASKTRDLHRNINDGDVEAVKNLLRESVDVTQVATDRGWTPLHTATLKGNVRMVEVIIANAKEHLDRKKFNDFVDARTTSGRNTALHSAAEGGHLEIALFLLQHRAIYELKNERGKKPVDVATTKKIGKLLTLIDELFERTKQGKSGVLDVVNGLSVDKIRAIFNTRNVQNQSLTGVAKSNKHTHLAGKLMEFYAEKVVM